MEKQLTNRLIEVLPRDLFLDLFDMTAARAREAHETVRDRFPYLSGKSARGAEGQIRFRIMEQGFQQICEKYGGILLEGGLVQGTDLRIFQPFMRFGQDAGVVIGLASMPDRGELPVKNHSRSAGVTLNYNIVPRLALDERDPKPGDIFILFLTARDPSRSGQIQEVAIGVVDSKYESFLFYEPIETFLARYAAPDRPSQKDGDSQGQSTKLVKLKSDRKAYKPPGSQEEDENNEGKEA
jgi:hypothetical protein